MDHPGVRLLTPGSNGIAILTSRQCRKAHAEIMSLINQLGTASSRAQGLSHVITTYASFASSDNTMYILTAENGKKALGFVKIGRRNLFLWDRRGVQHEKNVLCLLDFFTFPSCQRKGYGRKMIDAMLADSSVQMKQVPIDRPSSLCLSFMKSHFGLVSFLPQSNNFVVFDEFWREEMPRARDPKEKRVTIAAKVCPSKGSALQAVINPAKRTHFNPVTWSVHPGIDQ
jgi:alpha-tubulin N-acetyltransferase 1